MVFLQHFALCEDSRFQSAYWIYLFRMYILNERIICSGSEFIQQPYFEWMCYLFRIRIYSIDTLFTDLFRRHMQFWLFWDQVLHVNGFFYETKWRDVVSTARSFILWRQQRQTLYLSMSIVQIARGSVFRVQREVKNQLSIHVSKQFFARDQKSNVTNSSELVRSCETVVFDRWRCVMKHADVVTRTIYGVALLTFFNECENQFDAQ